MGKHVHTESVKTLLITDSLKLFYPLIFSSGILNLKLSKSDSLQAVNL